MNHRAFAAMAAMAVATGTAVLAASPAMAASPPPTPSPNSFPACNIRQDPGGPCNAAAYGLENPWDDGFTNCLAANYGELMKYRHQGYRSAACQKQTNIVDGNSWTLLVLYK